MKEDLETAIVRLRTAGWAAFEIAQELGVTTEKVREIVGRLLASGKLERIKQGRNARGKNAAARRAKHLEQITALRNQGLSNGEIAAHLKINLHTVDYLAVQLLKEGKIPPAVRGKTKSRQKRELYSSEAWQKREERIIALREYGYKNHEIASILRLKESVVNQACWRLIKAGRLKPRWGRPIRPKTEKEGQ